MAHLPQWIVFVGQSGRLVSGLISANTFELILKSFIFKDFLPSVDRSKALCKSLI